ncbi:uncharacterized protein LOC111705799 [Eurytemora carolleeae]|uniref:uncharacterized protein LOC111705799 n=1 Tax=Eurytemora carolleeae TaxID=1294199 RepID=UPI000C7894E5|nr:uncharacterized protein LOC111705799 [Eurytemora carolleeae]|eukprot:XP_023334236.1 uncharacterized protein LOC111705799 [Eurytemora affinis]
MNPKVVFLVAVGAICAQGATINTLKRQKRTLGVLSTAADAVAPVLSGFGTAAGIGTALVGAKAVALGLGGKYLLYKYLTRDDGVHVGVSGGVGANLPFGLPEVNAGASAGFGFGGSDDGVYVVDPPYSVVSSDVYSSPITYSSPVSYDAAPQVTYSSPAQVVSYNTAPQVSYSAPAQVVSYDTAPQVSYSAPVSFDNVDSYGAPQAPLLG